MKDRFSGHASGYAAFRPKYPADLFDFIYSHVKSFDLAWDAGTGNGQAAEALGARFKKVLGTDISSKQLEQATKLDNIEYAVAGETTSRLISNSVDLVTVAQAIHWFDRPLFYKEVMRVAKPGTVVAVWGYGLLRLSPSVDHIINHFYTEVVGPYWDPERRLIDDGLKTLDFPFEEIKAPSFLMTYQWSLENLEGYLNTWSATQRFIQANTTNPVGALMEKIASVYAQDTFSVEFPFFIRVGRVS